MTRQTAEGWRNMGSFSEDIRRRIAEAEEHLRAPGSVLFAQGRYEIQRPLGEGGMGITCLAHEISAANMRRPVVLKFVKDSLDPDRLAQFFNEVQLSVLFNHPNLVPVYRLESETLRIDIETRRSPRRKPYEHTVYYAVMQYIDGWNLRQIVNRTRALRIYLNYDVSMFIIGRIARGLHYVHEYRDAEGNHLGLVHRDVSPENILIDRFGRIKVGDFGITKGFRELRLTRPVNPGKLLYASPEQLTGGPVDRRSDIYNVGLLMYFLFTNRDRFGPERDLPKARERILNKMQKSPLAELEHVPRRLAEMCATCLRFDPAYRYQSCEDLSNDIDIYFKEEGKVITNDLLEEILNDMFSANPTFVSRRFIPLTGKPELEQPEYSPEQQPAPEEPLEKPLPTLRIESQEEGYD